MLDYFKHLNRQGEKAPENNDGNEKVFKVILAGFAVMIIYGIIEGIAADTLREQIDNGLIQMSLSDIVILGGIAVCYGVSHLKNGGKK